jgi:hypothetical protein
VQLRWQVQAAARDVDLHAVAAEAHDHGDRTRLAGAVLGERLLDDTVGGQVDAGGQRARIAFQAELDGAAVLAQPLDQRVQLA